MPAGKRPRRIAARYPTQAESAGRAAASGEANDCFYPVSFRTQYSSRVFREFAGVLRLIISQQSAASIQPKTITAEDAKDAKGKKISTAEYAENAEKKKGLLDQIQTVYFSSL